MSSESKQSSRHKKISGDFGEHLILFWLSKQGYECVHIDHTGIDLIAATPDGKQRLGISVKSRTRRTAKTARVGITVIKNKGDTEKLKSACKAFGCEPYIAVISDADVAGGEQKIYGFMTSYDHFCEMQNKGTKTLTWKIDDKSLQKHRDDPEVKMFECGYRNYHWDESNP